MDIPSRCLWDHGDVQESIPGRTHRPVTQDDVAQKAGVSRARVSLAFRGAPGVSEESRRTILETGRLLGYRHNVIAADLATKTRSTIGLYLLDFRNEVFADVFRGARDALERSGNRVILGVSDADEPTDQRAVGSLIEAQVGAASTRSCAIEWKRGIAGRFGR